MPAGTYCGIQKPDVSTAEVQELGTGTYCTVAVAAGHPGVVPAAVHPAPALATGVVKALSASAAVVADAAPVIAFMPVAMAMQVSCVLGGYVKVISKAAPVAST